VTDELRGAYSASRLTRQRREIAAAVTRMPGAFSAAQLAAELHGNGVAAGLATVYRALTSLEASGWIEKAGQREGAALFTHCAVEHHHHHLVCTTCGRVEHAPCPLEGVLAGVAESTGFVITGHDVALYGTCAACGAREGAQ
jgi:Fur family ferric uptake transcriptional regulator